MALQLSLFSSTASLHKKSSSALSSFASWVLPVLLALCLNCASVAVGAPTSAEDAVRGIAPATILAGVIAIVSGLLFCFFGTKMWRLTIFAAGFYVFASLGLTVLLNIEAAGTNFGENREWILLGGSFAIGFVGGFLAVCFYKLGVFLVGAVGGLFFAAWLMALTPNGLISNGIGRTIFIIAVMLICGLLTIKFEKHVVIIGTSFAGAFLVAIGIDFFARTGFTDAVARFMSAAQKAPKGAAEQFANGGYANPGQVYALLAGMVVLAILGAVFQYRRYTAFGKK